MKRLDPDEPYSTFPVGLFFFSVIVCILAATFLGCAQEQTPGEPCGHVKLGVIMCVVDNRGGCERVVITRVFPEPATTAMIQYEGIFQPVETACANLW